MNDTIRQWVNKHLICKNCEPPIPKVIVKDNNQNKNVTVRCGNHVPISRVLKNPESVSVIEWLTHRIYAHTGLYFPIYTEPQAKSIIRLEIKRILLREVEIQQKQQILQKKKKKDDESEGSSFWVYEDEPDYKNASKSSIISEYDSEVDLSPYKQ